jgi:alkylation response protein AidB-like acyl-CoA dehydrogenase
MNFGLDEDENLLVTSVRRFVDRAVKPVAADADRAGEFAKSLLSAATDLGFFVDAVPEESGGLLEGDYSHLARALRGAELGRGCSALAALLEQNVEPALAVARWGSDNLKRTFFGALAEGKSAIFHRDTGATVPIPGVATASFALIARDGGKPLLFVVAVDKNVTPVKPSSWRAAAWGTLRVDGKIEKDHILAEGAAARRAITEIATWSRVSLAARALGVAREAIACARKYSHERVQFGQPIGRFESIRDICDRNESAIEAAWLLTLKAAWQIDQKQKEAGDNASRARQLAAEVVSRATIDAVQVYGGYGFVNDFPVEKLMRDAPAYGVLGGDEGTHRIIHNEFEESHGSPA